MAEVSLPVTATKVWVPLLVNGGKVLTIFTGLQMFSLTDADALTVLTAAYLFSPLLQSALTWLQKNFLTQPVDIVTPGMAPNIPISAGTPWWHHYVRYAAVAVGAGLTASLIWWVT